MPLTIRGRQGNLRIAVPLVPRGSMAMRKPRYPLWSVLLGLLIFFVMVASTYSSAVSLPRTGIQQGFPVQLPGGQVIESSPVFADIDNDGYDEILVGTTAVGTRSTNPYWLVAVNHDGSILWQRNTEAPIKSSPAAGDIDNDGDIEVVVSVGGDPGDLAHHGGVVAYNGADGAFLWKFYTRDHIGGAPDGYADGVFSSPALGDVDGDGDLEIAFGAWDDWIYLIDHNGQKIWDYPNLDTIWSTPAMADLRPDVEGLEIIIGADITGNPYIISPTYDGGYLYVFDKDGHVLVKKWVDETVFSSPAIGDIDSDGNLEIVVGTGLYWWAQGNPTTFAVYAWDGNGNLLPGWPAATEFPGFSSPALADLDDDGDLEIITGSGDFEHGKVYAWHHDGNPVAGWPVTPRNSMGTNHFIRSSPTVADYDGDGELEILFAMLWDIQVYGSNGSLEEILSTTFSLLGSPAIGDIDHDGRLEISIGGSDYFDQSHGYLYLWEASSALEAKLPWPTFHQNAQHTGLYPSPPTLSVDKGSLLFLHPEGENTNPYQTLTIDNLGSGTIEWVAAASEPNLVSMVPSSGTALPASPSQVVITVDASGYPAGTYNLGSITIDGGPSVLNSPYIIQPVTLYVGPVEKFFFPLVVKEGD